MVFGQMFGLTGTPEKKKTKEREIMSLFSNVDPELVTVGEPLRLMGRTHPSEDNKIIVLNAGDKIMVVGKHWPEDSTYDVRIHRFDSEHKEVAETLYFTASQLEGRKIKLG